MSWLSKGAKSVEHAVSTTATKLGVGNDLKKAANVFGAAYVGGNIGAATGFLTGGVPGLMYGAGTGAVVAGLGKYKGDSSSKYLSNAAGDAAIAGALGPMIYKPGASALITAPGPVSSYGATTKVFTSGGSPIGSLIVKGAGSLGNTIGDALTYIGKGGLTGLVTTGISKLFAGKPDPATHPNPDYQQGNAVPPGGTFPQWLTNILPGKSYDPTLPGASTSGGGGNNPSSGGGTAGGSNPQISVNAGMGDGSGFDLGALKTPLLLIAAGIGGFFLIKKGGILHHA